MFFFICRELVKYLIMYMTSKRCIKFNFCTTWKSNCMKEYDSYLIGHIALWSLMWWGLVRWSLWLRRLKVKRPCMCEKRHHLSTLTFLKEATDNSSVWKKLPYYKIIIKWLLWFNQLQQKNFVGMNQGSIEENYIHNLLLREGRTRSIFSTPHPSSIKISFFPNTSHKDSSNKPSWWLHERIESSFTISYHENKGYRMVYEKVMHPGKYQPSFEIAAFYTRVLESRARCMLNSLEVLNSYNSVSDFQSRISQSCKVSDLSFYTPRTQDCLPENMAAFLLACLIHPGGHHSSEEIQEMGQLPAEG